MNNKTRLYFSCHKRHPLECTFVNSGFVYWNQVCLEKIYCAITKFGLYFASNKRHSFRCTYANWGFCTIVWPAIGLQGVKFEASGSPLTSNFALAWYIRLQITSTLDSFTVSVHSTNSRQFCLLLGLCKAAVRSLRLCSSLPAHWASLAWHELVVMVYQLSWSLLPEIIKSMLGCWRWL